MANVSKPTNDTKSNTSAEDKVLETTIKMIEKKFGEGALMRLGARKRLNVQTISTGAVSLDVALGVGGLPRGRVVEVFGPEASGKTTIALHIIAAAQQSGLKVAFIDAEHALDPIYAKNIGVDVNNLYISQPDYGEQALEIIDTLVRSGVFGVIVLDSVAALVPRAEVEGNMGDVHMGLQARLMSQGLRKITPLASKTNTTVLFINQIRMDLGVKFGNPETTPGGRALKFYSSVRLDVRRREAIKDAEGTIIGHVREVKVVKNKVAPPFRSAKFPIYFSRGIDKVASLIEALIKLKIIEQKGSYFVLGDKNIAQGKANFIKLLEEDKNLREKLTKQVYKVLLGD